MTPRQQQILQRTVEWIADEGYAALTMRSVAKVSGMTLGALQYHFPHRRSLLEALTAYIAQQYREEFAARMATAETGIAKLHACLDGFPILPADDRVQGDRLFPQLWAMAKVEPLMTQLIDDIYDEYLLLIEECLREQGVSSPRPDALALMSLLEGTTLFIGEGCRWQSDGPATIQAIRAMIDSRYG